MDFTTIKEVNVLGYSGQYLALLFETLSACQFKGKLNIILNDGIKRSEADFKTNIEYAVLHMSEVNEIPQNMKPF